MKKKLLVASLTALTMLSATSAFAQEALNSTIDQKINFVSSESLSEKYPEHSHQRYKRRGFITSLVPTLVRNVKGPWTEHTTNPLRRSNFDYPGGIMSVTEKKKASFGGSVTSGILSTALNFQVDNEFTISDSQNIQVPEGKRAKVTAYRADDVWSYELYQEVAPASDIREAIEIDGGTHWARKPVGVWFEVEIY